MEDMSYIYTIGGYAALIGIGYVVYQVSTQKNRKRAGAASTKSVKSAQSEPRKEDRKKKQRLETFASEVQESSKKAAKAKASSPTLETATPVAKPQDNSPDDNLDNLKFARQLSKAKEGAKFSTKADGGKQREKSVKQSRAKLIDLNDEKESAPSSTTGGDADDDQSPISSPEVGPVVTGDVSDMLEPAQARPSVLRITDAAPKQQKQKVVKAPEHVETKKQRQNRKKAEAAKAAREEAEKERKVLEEKQRRTARIAEGRAAKDGSQFTAAKVGKSAWTEGAPSGTNSAAPAAKTNGFHQPLDTFEPSTTAATSKPAEDNWVSDLPSEEKQMEMIKSDEDEWSTVKTKSSKKAAKNDSSVDSGDEPSRPSAQPKQVSAINKAAKPSQSFGSFSALSTKNDQADEEEVEEEWL